MHTRPTVTFFCPEKVGIDPSPTGESTPSICLTPSPASSAPKLLSGNTVQGQPRIANGGQPAPGDAQGSASPGLLDDQDGAGGNVAPALQAAPHPGRSFSFPPGPVWVYVCSWCQSVMGCREDERLKKTELTHGMCALCRVKFLRGDKP